MASTDIWWPVYVGDYLKDTSHLSTAEHGAYFLILNAYYANQQAPTDDDNRFARITRQTLSDWQLMRPTIAAFFDIQHGLWTHKRADFEIAKAITTQAARIKGANATNAKLGRGLADTLSERSATRSPCRSIDGKSQSQSESQSESKAQPKTKSEEETALSGKPDGAEMKLLTQSRVVLHFLNEKAGRHYREVAPNLDFIRERLKEPGVTVEGIKVMVERQIARWKGTEWEKFLRPQTLFNRTKFADYYDTRELPVESGSKKPNHEEGF